MSTIKHVKYSLKLKLEQSDIYLHFRYSRIFLTIWKMLRKDAAVKLNQQRKFYIGVLRNIKDKNSIIFDIGANEGYTTEIFTTLSSKILAVEPSPLNARILRQRFSNLPGVIVREQAVSDRMGRGALYVETGTALHTLNARWKELLEKEDHPLKTEFINIVAVNTTTLSSLISEVGLPVFIKIDTEGYEQQVISTLQEPVPQILFEAILPEFLEETLACIHHLHKIDNSAVFNYAINNCMILDRFVDLESMLPAIFNINASADIICRMSNYRNFYN